MRRLLTLGLATLFVSAVPACKKKETAPKTEAGHKNEAESAKPQPAAAKPKVETAAEADQQAQGRRSPEAIAASNERFRKLAKYIPDEATNMFVVDVKGVIASSLWKEHKERVLGDNETKRRFDAFKKCEIDPEKFEAIVVASGAKEYAAAVIAAEGVGNFDKLKCVAGAFAEKEVGKKVEIKLEERKGRKVVVFPEEEGIVGIPIDENLLVLAQNGWTDIVTEVLAGKRKNATEGSLKSVLTQVDTSKNAWFVATFPDQAASLLANSPLGGATHVSGSVDFSAGLAFAVKFGLENKAQAATATDALKGIFDQQKPMLAMLGIPQTVVEKVSIAANNSQLVAKVSLDNVELKALSDRLGQMVAANQQAQQPLPSANGASSGSGAAPKAAVGSKGTATAKGEKSAKEKIAK